MKRLLAIDGVPTRIEILSLPPECCLRLDDGPERQAHVEIPESGVYSVLLDGRIYEARVEDSGTGLMVTIGGRRFDINLTDLRQWTGKSGRAAGQGVQTITAPMPGKVVRVLIEPGQNVEAGQGLVVVEAMKMQNELKAPRPGRVLTVTAREGDTVAAAEVLATIE